MDGCCVVNRQPENVRFSDDGNAVIILDQTLLPSETKYIELRCADELHEALTALRVRGAPAIGIYAAFALCILAQETMAEDCESFRNAVNAHSAYLNSARPTAVNLSIQLLRMEKTVDRLAVAAIPQIIGAMFDEARQIQREDIEMCFAISEYGLDLIRDGFGILTHCNAGPLATSQYGTGLGPILLAQERGIFTRVYCCETRPLLQGARLTAYELSRAGVDCTLICDNMASIVMKEGRIDAVFVGCDRVARNGDVANKIGTSGLAILANHYGIPFYVCCPSSTIDTCCMTGVDIVIEQRPPEEVQESYFSRPVAPDGIKCYNPAFDITDNRLITAIITDKGICKAPYNESLAQFTGVACTYDSN